MSHFKDFLPIDGMHVVRGLEAGIFGRAVGFDLADLYRQALVFAPHDHEAPGHAGVGPVDGDVHDLLGHLEYHEARNQLRDKLGKGRQKSWENEGGSCFWPL